MKIFKALLMAGLVTFSAGVFAEDHGTTALSHAQAAAAKGKEGDCKGLVEHAGKALEHTLAGALVSSGATKNHLQAASNELEEAINHGNLNHAEIATEHTETAIAHINKANEK